jgi:hypothetical protein
MIANARFYFPNFRIRKNAKMPKLNIRKGKFPNTLLDFYNTFTSYFNMQRYQKNLTSSDASM